MYKCKFMSSEMETLQILTQLLMAFILFGYCAAQTRDDSIRLMEDVLRGYNRQHRPVLNYSKPVQVNVTFEVVSLKEFDEVNGVMSVVLLMYMTWYDEIITWIPASYGGIDSQMFDIEDVWYPLVVIGSSSENFKDLAEDWMTLRIYSSGLALFSPGLLVKSSCGIDVTFYPFDIQNCYLLFGPWAHTQKELNLASPVPHLFRTFYTEHGEWKLIGNSSSINSNKLLSVHLKFERKPLFAVVNTILPVVLMSVLNLLVFVLPADSGERVSYTITVLLAIAVFLTLIADNLPKTSEPISVLAYFLMTNLIGSCLICITTILNLRTFYKSDDRQIPGWQQRMVRMVGCSKSSITYKNHRKNTSMTESKCSDRCCNIEDSIELKGEMNSLKPDRQYITWKDVAIAIDKILMTFFCIVGLINILLFLVIITFRLGI